MPYQTFINLPEEKKQKLLECAIEEFAKNDYQSASITKIVNRAGIAKGSLYQYFKDKQDLYNYLLELAIQKKTEIFNSSSKMAPSITWFEMLTNLFQVMASYEMRYPQLSKIGFRATSGNSPLPEELVLKAKQSTSQYFLEMVEEGKRRGEIRPEVDSSIAVLIFTSTLSGLGDYVRSGARVDLSEMRDYSLVKELRLETIFKQIVSILQDGIAL
ncbi:MAG TPA: TetR/AcrR family transcriptional regulator [Anaerovoracaceae bacterium]|nr:TetR/AcrR family transcriptional regulator [Anaerovoracaceae bacterium]